MGRALSARHVEAMSPAKEGGRGGPPRHPLHSFKVKFLMALVSSTTVMETVSFTI